LTKSKV